MSSRRKMIAVSKRTYKNLAQLGDLEDSFDSVISKLIASAGLSFARPDQQKAIDSAIHKKE
jgi:hypothetical protein